MFAVLSANRRNWGSFVLHSAALTITATRGAAIALGVGLSAALVLAQLDSRADRANASNRVPAALFVTVLLTIFFVTPLATETYAQLANSTRGSGIAQREAPIRFGVDLFRDNPILGSGFLGTTSAGQRINAGQYFGEGVDVSRATYTAQNQWVQTAADAGIACLLPFGVLVVRIVAQTNRLRRASTGDERADARGMQAALLAMIVATNQPSGSWHLPPRDITSLCSPLLAAGAANFADTVANRTRCHGADTQRRRLPASGP